MTYKHTFLFQTKRLNFLHIPHPFATKNSVKLACVKHTTSVHPEPGSNSYYYNLLYLIFNKLVKIKIYQFFKLFKNSSYVKKLIKIKLISTC